jgi:hypothetical protein
VCYNIVYAEEMAGPLSNDSSSEFYRISARVEDINAQINEQTKNMAMIMPDLRLEFRLYERKWIDKYHKISTIEEAKEYSKLVLSSIDSENNYQLANLARYYENYWQAIPISSRMQASITDRKAYYEGIIDNAGVSAFTSRDL